MDSTPITHDEIMQRAHDIWEQCGRPEGHEIEHWLQAERELRTEREQADRIRHSLGSRSPYGELRSTAAPRTPEAAVRV